MKFWQTIPFAMAALVIQAQTPVSTPLPAPASVPLYRVTVVQNSAKAINYGQLKASTKIDFRGTALLPAASGVAKVKSGPHGTAINASFKNLAPASSFGGEFLTYVLWAVSTEGRATNLGELALKKGKCSLEVTEQLQIFGLVVTAEPYFAVTQPSDVVVLENTFRKDAASQVEPIDAKYDLLKRGQYTLNLGAEPMVGLDAKRPLLMAEAHNAVRIAKASGAEVYAGGAFSQAVTYLKQADSNDGSLETRVMAARESVQSAEDSRLIAVKRQAAEQSALDQKLSQDQVDLANRQAAMASAAEASAVNQAAVANAAANTALNQAAAAKADNADLRAELLAQLNSVLETRATARGLIVNMSGVLFQNGKATLLPAAREKLAKIAGILSTHKGLIVEADGYTDNTGSLSFNLVLSGHRAGNAKDYLVSQGVSAQALTSKGFGVENPIASNTTVAGRQENRRVELVVSGEGITVPAAATN